MNLIVQQIASEYKAHLKKLYDNELVELILFGSHGRGDFNISFYIKQLKTQ